MSVRFASALLALPLIAHGQPAAPSTPPVGSRVRLESSSIFGRSVAGSLTVMNQGFVTLALDPARSPATQISVPWSRIYDISLSGGKERRRGVTTGVLVGIGASIIAYPAMLQTVEEGESRLAPALLSFGLLPVTGAVLGWFNSPESWSPLTWRPTQDTVMPDGHVTRLRLAPETQVRALVASRWISGRVLATTDDSLVVRAASRRQSFDWESVMLMHRRTKRSRTRGAAIGITLAGGATAATVVWGPRGQRKSAHLLVGNLLIGGAAGALVGAPGWTRVPIPLR